MLQHKIKAIDIEVVQLHYKWKYFKQIFGSKEKVALLNDAAPVFFSFLWNSILFDILLSFSRLLDPDESFGHENLSFENLLADISDSSLKIELSKLISELKSKAQAIKTWRDQKISHNDLARSLNKVPLPPIPVDELAESLATIRHIMNILQRRFNAQTVVYEICFEHDPGDAKSLMYYLKYGFDAFKEDINMQERLGIWSRKDNEITKWLND